MKKIEELLKEHRFFEGLPKGDVDLIAGCGKNSVVTAGKYIAHEGDVAEAFYVIRHGKVAIEIQGPGRGPIVLQTLGDGDVVGWSWLFPPYQWFFDIRAVDDVRMVAMDGVCLRKKAEEDPALGYRLMKTFAREMNERLQAARLQMLDIYGQRSD